LIGRNFPSHLRGLLILFLSGPWYCGLAAQPVKGAGHTPDEVLLVSNANSPISLAIAEDYTAKRGVSKSVVIHCADSAVSTANETISPVDYTSRIAAPIGAYLKQHPEINFIVLTKGVPIRVRGGETGSHDENLPASAPLNASVDSYLAAMDYPSRPDAVKIAIHGSGARGLAWLNHYWKADVPFSHAKYGGYLVTRLDGYTQADAEALVTRALAAEMPQTSGGDVLLDVQPIFKFKSTDVAGQPLDVTGDILDESDYGSWNADMVKAGDMLIARKIRTELDRDEAFVGDRSNLRGYFSWGSNDAKYNEKAYESLTFAPGAIGDTAVSTSARTFLPTSGGQSLITDLIAHGITGVKGYTDEPLLQAIASPSIVMERYTSGFTLAESLSAASRFVGWEDVVIGDPLCRPAFWRTASH
jgi:uncharacterized protein (TIGR03790 family)